MRKTPRAQYIGHKCLLGRNRQKATSGRFFLTQIIHKKLKILQVSLIAETFIEFEGTSKQYVENLIDVLESKERRRFLNFP